MFMKRKTRAVKAYAYRMLLTWTRGGQLIKKGN